MGYTHYWHRPVDLDPAKFASAVDDATELLLDLPPLFGGDGFGESEFKPDGVCFNGDESRGEGHETFHIPLKFEGWDSHPERPMKFAFCKTARKPYDLAVMATLLVFKHHFGDGFTVSSDGDLEDWQPAIDLVDRVLGYGSEWAFDREGDRGLVETAKAS